MTPLWDWGALMSAEKDPLRVFYGEAEQKAYMQGVSSHGYDGHPNDRKGLSRDRYASKARADLNSSNRGIVVRQGSSQNVLWGNTAAGTVGWSNTEKPQLSTYFRPKAGVDRYIGNRERALKALGQDVQRVDPPAIRKDLVQKHPSSAALVKPAQPNPPSLPKVQPAPRNQPSPKAPDPPRPPIPRPK